jgi:hypothetical protein
MAGPFDGGYNPGDTGYGTHASQKGKGKKAKGKAKGKPRSLGAGSTPPKNTGKKIGGAIDRPRKQNHGAFVSKVAREGAGGKAVSTIARSDAGKKRTSPKAPATGSLSGFQPTNPIGPGRPGFSSSTPRSLGSHPATGQAGTIAPVNRRRRLPSRKTLA